MHKISSIGLEVTHNQLLLNAAPCPHFHNTFNVMHVAESNQQYHGRCKQHVPIHIYWYSSNDVVMIISVSPLQLTKTFNVMVKAAMPQWL